MVARGENWHIPVFWAPMIRWLSAPILMILLSFAYANVHKYANDPLHIFGLIVAHIAIFFVSAGFLLPMTMNMWTSLEERDGYKKQYAKGPREVLEEELTAIDEKGKEDDNLEQGSTEQVT